MNLLELKRAAFEMFLERGTVGVMVWRIDAGVVGIPDHVCRGKSHVLLEYDLNQPGLTQNLTVDAWGITSLISFNARPYTVRIPWIAILWISTRTGTDQEDMVAFQHNPNPAGPMFRDGTPHAPPKGGFRPKVIPGGKG